MPACHYDDLPLNEDMLLDLPFREGTGAITQDLAKPHHAVDLINTPTWASEASGLGVLTFDGTSEYAEAQGADTADLDFTNGDYSVSAWIKWAAGQSSQIVIARYEVSVSGWEVYLYEAAPTFSLTLRHHHAAGATTRTGVNSLGWTQGVWHHMGISRVGAAAYHYRNGVLLDTTITPGGLIDPATCNQDLVIGIRYSKDTNWYKGSMWRPRVWGRALSAKEWLTLYELERGWF